MGNRVDPSRPDRPQGFPPDLSGKERGRVGAVGFEQAEDQVGIQTGDLGQIGDEIVGFLGVEVAEILNAASHQQIADQGFAPGGEGLLRIKKGQNPPRRFPRGLGPSGTEGAQPFPDVVGKGAGLVRFAGPVAEGFQRVGDLAETGTGDFNHRDAGFGEERAQGGIDQKSGEKMGRVKREHRLGVRGREGADGREGEDRLGRVASGRASDQMVLRAEGVDHLGQVRRRRGVPGFRLGGAQKRGEAENEENPVHRLTAGDG